VVPAGSPKPDVSTAEALKRTLLQAKSIGFTGVGSSRAGNEKRPFEAAQKKGGRSRPLIGYPRITAMRRS
jgi:hypothetical protein